MGSSMKSFVVSFPRRVWRKQGEQLSISLKKRAALEAGLPCMGYRLRIRTELMQRHAISLMRDRAQRPRLD